MQHNIYIEKLENGQAELIIREGAALPVLPDKKLVIAGNIDTVTSFLSARTGGNKGKGLQEIDREKAIITIDEEKMFIKLEVDPNNPDGTEVTAKLEYTPEFLQFKVNTGSQFTREQFVKLLRFNRRFFPNADRYDDMLKAFMAFQVKTETEIKSQNDTRGNKSSSIDKKVDSYGLPLDFVLAVSVFKGKGVESFRVEICIETTEGSARFWLESPELEELIDRRKKEIFATLTKDYSDFAIVRI